MAKITLPDVVSINNVSTINSNFQDIASELDDKVLYRDNPDGEPNQMLNDLDMNSNRILNLPKPLTSLEPVRLIDVLDTTTVDQQILEQALVEATAAAVAAEAARVAAVAAQNNASAYAEDAYDNSRLTVGTVTTAAPGDPPQVTIDGVPGTQVLNFVLPRTGDGAGGKIRIVVLGDSMTARQAGLDEVWPDALATTLNAAGADVEVFNVAVNGATHHSALNDTIFNGMTQVTRCIAYAPDVVIVALGLNDSYRATSVGVTTVGIEAATLYNTITGALPNVNIIYASQTPFDKLHGSPATLTNEQTFPIFCNPRTTGLLAGTYAPEIMPEPCSALHKEAMGYWVTIDNTIRSFGKPVFEMPLWQACRLGLTQSDAFHINYPGHKFVAQAAFNWCRTATSIFPNLSTQGYNSWNDWAVAFNTMLVTNGTRFVNKDIVGSDAGFVCFWGPWNTSVRERWFSQSKASLTYDIYGNNYVKRQNVWGFTIQGALPGAEIYQSVNETTWQLLGKADSRGYYRYSVLLEGLDVPNGNYTHRVRVGMDVFPNFDYAVSGSSAPVPSSIPPSIIEQGGATTGQYLSWNGSNWVPTSGPTNKAYFVAAGAESLVTLSRGGQSPVKVSGSIASHPSNVTTDGGYWVGATAPVTGIYTINITLWTSDPGFAGRIYASTLIGTAVRFNMGFSQTPTVGDLTGASFSITVPVTQGEAIRPEIYLPPGTGQTSTLPNTAADRWNTWSIVQVG